jgi:PAS domain S-box-containing protein
LSEKISKKYDPVLDDVILSGRISDVTTSQLYALQIKESEERFRNLMDNVPVMVWVSNEMNIVTYSNKALKAFLGLDLEGMNDYRDYAAYVHPDDTRVAIDDWKKSISKRKSILSEYRLKDAKGEYHNILEKAVPRFLQDGSYAGYIGAYFDLTKEKQFQQNLLQEKVKMELMSQYSPDITMLVDSSGVIEYVSPTIKRILGYAPEKVFNKKITQFICPACNKMLKSNTWLSMHSIKSKKYEFQMVHQNGQLVWIDAGLNLIKDPTTSSNKIMLHLRDTTNLKHTQKILEQSEQKYRSLFENMKLGVMEVDLKDNITWINKAFESMSGYTLKQLKGKNAFNVFLSSTVEVKKMTKINSLRKKKKESIYEVQMKRKNGKLLDVVISGSPVIDVDGSVRGSVGIHWDVTEIREMEKALEQEKEIIQREVLKATLTAEEKQRQMLGHELHDGVGQMLTYISLYLQVAANNKEYDPNSFLKAQVKVKDALNEVRRISRSLAPPALIDLGLREAIVELLNQYTEIRDTVFTLTCTNKDFDKIDFNAQRTIYRVVQELVNNAIKYARANFVKVTFTRTKTKLILKYTDDGIGFNPQKVKKGVGLKSINNRIYFYGGTTNVQSIKNKGTSFTIELPLQNIINHG